jgi:hypothetical protein
MILNETLNTPKSGDIGIYFAVFKKTIVKFSKYKEYEDR